MKSDEGSVGPKTSSNNKSQVQSKNLTANTGNEKSVAQLSTKRQIVKKSTTSNKAKSVAASKGNLSTAAVGNDLTSKVLNCSSNNVKLSSSIPSNGV